MATYTSRVVSSERHEWMVPVDAYGACWVEVYKAVSAAHQDLWARGLVPDGKDASDDTIRVNFDDENIVVFYVLERDDSGIERLR